MAHINASGGLVNVAGAPTGNLIQKVKILGFPQFLFEFHAESGKVYLIDLDAGKDEKGRPLAQVIAEHCDTEGRAYGFVQTYLRGFRRGRDNKIVAPIL